MQQDNENIYIKKLQMLKIKIKNRKCEESITDQVILGERVKDHVVSKMIMGDFN